jgi:hypothetical protein
MTIILYTTSNSVPTVTKLEYLLIRYNSWTPSTRKFCLYRLEPALYLLLPQKRPSVSILLSAGPDKVSPEI